MNRFVYDETDSLFVILLVVFFLVPPHLSIHLLSFLALSMCHSSLEAPSSCITDSIHTPSVLRSSMHFSSFLLRALFSASGFYIGSTVKSME